MEAVGPAVGVDGQRRGEHGRCGLQLIVGGGGQVACRQERLGKAVVVKAMVQMCLVWDGGGDAVDGSGGDVVAPVVVVVGVLCVEGGGEGLGVGQMEGVGGGEEVGEGLVFHVAEQRLAGIVQRARGTVEEVEGVAKGRWVLVAHGGTREAAGRSSREPGEGMERDGLQLDGEGASGGDIRGRGGRTGGRGGYARGPGADIGPMLVERDGAGGAGGA